jgi:hypothetical protein
VFLKLSERLADVAGDGWFLRDDECFAHVALFLYAARRRLRNLNFFPGNKFSTAVRPGFGGKMNWTLLPELTWRTFQRMLGALDL